jgi:glyoxylase-like metal-dependent hydrolase (beta-lactamase superfamily II)
MKRILLGLAAALVVAAGLGALIVYDRVTALDYQRVKGDVHVIFGMGGNVGVLATESGAVVVDTMTFVSQGRRIRDLAENLGGGPTQAVVNTHYHLDHTHGNPAFPLGTKVVATQRTRDYLFAFDPESWTGDAESNAPNVTFDESLDLEIGGKTIRLLHLGRGHTDGDLVVLFVEDRVLHLGDLFFNGRYPNIDLEAGGSVAEWSRTLDRAMELDFDLVIPGHGPVTDREGVRAFQRFLDELWTKASARARAGDSLEEAVASVELREDEGYETMEIPFILDLDRDFVVGRAWQEASGAVQPVDVPVVKVEREKR